jgi:hypothetical protein
MLCAACTQRTRNDPLVSQLMHGKLFNRIAQNMVRQFMVLLLLYGWIMLMHALPLMTIADCRLLMTALVMELT